MKRWTSVLVLLPFVVCDDFIGYGIQTPELLSNSTNQSNQTSTPAPLPIIAPSSFLRQASGNSSRRQIEWAANLYKPIIDTFSKLPDGALTAKPGRIRPKPTLVINGNNINPPPPPSSGRPGAVEIAPGATNVFDPVAPPGTAVLTPSGTVISNGLSPGPTIFNGITQTAPGTLPI